MDFKNINAITIYEVEELKELFLEQLSKEDNLCLDMSKIEKIDLVGMQLLIALLKSAENRQKKLDFINISAPLREQMQKTHCLGSLGISI